MANRTVSRAGGAKWEALESRLVLAVAAPTGLDAALVAPRAVVVEWNDVAGETSYLVERRVDGTTEPWTVVGDTGANVTRFAQDGLSPGRTYLYRVRARDASGSSAPSNIDHVTVPREQGVPAAPRLEARLVKDRAAELRWTDVANADGFRIERRVDGAAFAFNQVAVVAAGADRYVDDGLDAGKTYLYRVRAFNDQGDSAYSNTAFVNVPGAGVPSAPRELVAELVQGQFVRLRWVDVAGEAGYQVERRVDGTAQWVRVGNTAANVVTFADDELDRGRTYVYRVRAINGAGPSPYSNTAAVNVPGETGLPAAPRGLNAALAGERRVVLEWADVAGERGYKVERRLDGSGSGDWVQIGATGENVARFVDERVEPGKTYVYRVRAFSAAGHSSYSNTDAVVIPERPATPAAPRLEVGLVAPRAAKLVWTNVADETGYRVERRVDGSDEPWREIRAAGADVTTVTDDGLEAGKTYLYRVRAFNGAGGSAYSNVGFVRVLAEGLPTAPRDLRAQRVSATRVELRWLDAARETGYRIERRVDGTPAWVKVGSAPADATGFVDAKVVPGTTYVYRVRAFNALGNSPYSNTAAARAGGEVARPAAPRELRAAAVSPTHVDLTWVGVDGEGGYRIERRLAGSELWAKVGFVAADVTIFSDRGARPGQSYVYRVRAANAARGGESSAWSNTASATTPEATAFSIRRI